MLSSQDRKLLLRFAECVCIITERGVNGYELSCNWCTRDEAQYGSSDLEDVIVEFIQHLEEHHPEKLVDPVVSDEEIAETFGLSSYPAQG